MGGWALHPAAEDALYESEVMRRFAGVDLVRAPAPDETTILNFRHLLEEHDLCGEMLVAVNDYLESRGIKIATGTIVDGRTTGSLDLICNRKLSPPQHPRTQIPRRHLAWSC